MTAASLQESHHTFTQETQPKILQEIFNLLEASVSGQPQEHHFAKLVQAYKSSVKLPFRRLFLPGSLSNVTAKFKRVVTDENVPNMASHVLFQEIFGFVVIAEEEVHQFVVAWEGVQEVLIECTLNFLRAFLSVWLVEMSSNVLAEIQRPNAWIGKIWSEGWPWKPSQFVIRLTLFTLTYLDRFSWNLSPAVPGPKGSPKDFWIQQTWSGSRWETTDGCTLVAAAWFLQRPTCIWTFNEYIEQGASGNIATCWVKAMHNWYIIVNPLSLPVATATMSAFKIFWTTVVTLNQQDVASNVIDKPRIVTALPLQVPHPSCQLQWYVVVRTLQLKFESTHWAPHEHLLMTMQHNDCGRCGKLEIEGARTGFQNTVSFGDWTITTQWIAVAGF